MIGAILLVARSGSRRRWGGLVVIAVLAAVFSSAVLVALVGAHRTATSLDRFRDWARSSDVEFQGESVEHAQAIKRVLDADPAVRQTSLRYLANVFPIGGDESIPDLALLFDPAGEFGVTIDRVRVIEGRMPDPDASDEVILNEVAARLLDVGPGDHIPGLTFGGDDLEALFGDDGFPGFNGPQVDLEVVGIGRAPRDLPGELRRTDLIAVASPAFLAANPVAAWPPTVLAQFYDVDRDIAAVSQLVADQRQAAAGPDEGGAYHASGTTAADEYVDTTRRSIDGLVIGLLVFALVAAAVGGLATAQAAGREARASARSDTTLAALGMSRRARTLAIALPTFCAALTGVVAGSGVAVVASPILPRGRARLAEVSPGIWIDPIVLAAGVALLVVLVAALAMLTAARTTRRRPPVVDTGRATLTGWAITTFGFGAAVATGLRRASPARIGSTLARSAIVGMAIAIAGILAAGVVVDSIEELESDPAHWGWVWTTRPDAFGDGEAAAVLIADPDVASAGLHTTGTVILDGVTFQGMSLTASKGDLAFTLVRGRLPSSASEVALGTQTLHDLGVSIGDSVDVVIADGTTSTALQVVGTAVFPPTELATLDEGAVFTPDGLVQVVQGPPQPEFVIGYRDGADVAALERRLGDSGGFSFPIFSRARVPGSIDTVAQSTGVAWALAAFFLIVGIVGLLNTLTTSIRRDGHEFAVLRALGLRGRQVRQATLVQALALSTVGVVLGVPIGLITGRAVWRALSGDLGIAADPQVPWLLIGAVPPATALATALLCWWPARFAARSRPAVQLRAE